MTKQEEYTFELDLKPSVCIMCAHLLHAFLVLIWGSRHVTSHGDLAMKLYSLFVQVGWSQRTVLIDLEWMTGGLY